MSVGHSQGTVPQASSIGLLSGSVITCRLHTRRISLRSLPCAFNPIGLSQLISALDQPCILGGHDTALPGNHVSYWAANPVEMIDIPTDHPAPLDLLEQVLSKYRLAPTASTSPLFCCGWIGFFSYDLGAVIEPMPVTTQDDLGMPLIRLGFYDQCIAWDHTDDSIRLMALTLPHDAVTAEQKLDDLDTWVHDSHSMSPVQPTSPAIETFDFAETQTNMTKAQYLEAVAKIQRYLRDGETYQINFSHRFSLPFTKEPIDLFHWQNVYNPSPYSAFLGGPEFKIVSASPEMFLTIDNGLIRTKPIKGTRPKLSAHSDYDETLDQRNETFFRDLVNSEKEKAELNMIVDLERNDLARVCRPGTRHVIQPRFIESYATVYHAVATIGGQLKKGLGLCNILKRTFPGGSITGAPKIRSMQIIDEIEPTARGLYTGSIGFISVSGNACLNIAIRTIIIARQTAYVQTGGGIVVDSDPEAEYQETLIKARALLAGIEAVQKSEDRR